MNTQNKEGESINLLHALFNIEMEIKFQNTDNPDEPVECKTEHFNKLLCVINNQNSTIDQMNDGIQMGLEEQVEKMSHVDNQNHIFNKVSRINKLPSYLMVQMNRFFWK